MDNRLQSVHSSLNLDLSTYHVPSPMIGAGDTAVPKKQALPSRSLLISWGPDNQYNQTKIDGAPKFCTGINTVGYGCSKVRRSAFQSFSERS